MADTQSATGLGVTPRPLIVVFVVLCSLFAGTTLLAHWYSNERLARAQAYFESGKRFDQKGDMESAMEAYRNALQISPSDDYRLALAQALIKTKRTMEASVYLDELAREDATDAEPNLLLARIAASEDKTDQAVTSYQRAIYGFWPKDAQANRLAAAWELAGILEKTGMRKQLVAELIEISELAPDDDSNRLRAARKLLGNGSPAQAADIFREVLRHQPHSAEAEEGLAQADLALAQYSDAQAAFRKAIHEGASGDSARQGLELTSEILTLDPNMRGLNTAERYRRSVELVQRAAAISSNCELGPLTDEVHAAISARVRSKDYETATDKNINLAQQLWRATANCRQNDPALERILARIGR
jgi:cytochrome c-type biogenesis protein CcmH/NrfG